MLREYASLSSICSTSDQPEPRHLSHLANYPTSVQDILCASEHTENYLLESLFAVVLCGFLRSSRCWRSTRISMNRYCHGRSQHGLTRLGQNGGSIGRKSGGFNPNLSGCSLIDEHALRAIVLSLREQCSLLHTAELCFV